MDIKIQETKLREAASEGTDAFLTCIRDAILEAIGGEVNAAIATALHLYLNDTVHDVESGIITIAPRQSAWNDKTLTFRKTPRK